MMESISHRGPDTRGSFVDDEVSLGICRLSIIDLVTGDQPITNEDGSVIVVYNGEIYNFQELRDELGKKGHVFSTQSDTEVIPHLYEELGESFPTRLKGMFAIALWDKEKGKLLLVRDHVGIKPLHYHLTPKNDLVFGSEVKSILQWHRYEPALDLQGLHYMLNLRYVPGNHTLFKGIKRLPPGHLLIWQHRRVKIRKYYSFDFSIDRSRSEEEWLESLHETLLRAMNQHLVSDVPLGVYLSGGLDSSTIVAYLRLLGTEEVHTFTLGFNEKTDENKDAAFVADTFGTRHRETRVSLEPLQALPEIVYYMEEPKVNQLQGYLLSRFTRQHVKVILSGLGGDELFGGYITNRFIQVGRWINPLMKELRVPVDSFSRGLARLDALIGDLRFNEYRRGLQMGLNAGAPEQFYLILRNAWDFSPQGFRDVYGEAVNPATLEETAQFFRPYFQVKGMNFLEACLMAEFSTKLVDDFLVNEDRTSMANSLESRVPYLDRDLVELCLRMPGHLKVRLFKLKYLFRRLLADKLPEKTLKKKKWGFAFNPYEQYLKDLRGTALRILTEKRIAELGLFNYNFIHKILLTKPSPRLRWHYFYLWLLIGFDIWHRLFIERSRDFGEPLTAFFNDG